MANVRISELPIASTPLSGAEEIPMVQNGGTVKATVNQLGNLFSANTLQSVTDNGNNTTNDIEVKSVGVYDETNDAYVNIGTTDNGILIKDTADTEIFVVQIDAMSFGQGTQKAILHNNLLNAEQDYEFPNASGTLALTTDITPSTLQQVTTLANRVLTNNVNLQGTNAGTGTFSGTDINAFGSQAAKENSGSNVNALGNQACQNNSGSYVNGIGYVSAFGNSGSYINASGYQACISNSGSKVNALGTASASSNSGDNVNAFGTQAAIYNNKNDINALGFQSAYNNSGSSVNSFGNLAANNNSGNNVNAFGYSAGNGNTFNNVTLLGNSAQATAAKQLVLSDGTLNARISYIGISANRTYELPDVSGTLTITSGVGTSGFITRWVSATAVGASTLLSDNANTISIGNSSPSASARLQVDSTTSGFLPPRMTTTNRNAISSPAEGLCVYDTTLHKLYVYDGTIWQACW